MPTNQKVTATFSEAMDATTIDGTTNFTVKGANEAAMVGAVSLDTAGTTATFTPNSNFTPSTEYTATITTAVKSATGAALANDYVWTFNTGLAPDVTAPTVVSTSPADTDTGVLRNQNITATFDEALDPATVNDTSFTLTADSGATVITGSVSYLNLDATFTPDVDLVAETLYTATLTTAITDSAVPANALAADYVWSFTTSTAVATGPAAIDLGTAADFAVVAASAITSAGSTTITGNIALSPAAGSFITVSCTELPGYEVFTVDGTYVSPVAGSCTAVDKGAAATAIADVQAAYTAASAPATPAAVGANLNIGAGTVTAQTLVPGTYTWGTGVTITGDITLEGGANDVWIFQIDGTLDLAAAKSILLSGAGPAQAKNVFWRVSDTVSLNSGSVFKGNVLAQTNINMISGATITGRLLAQTAAALGTTTAVTQPAP